jgi:hypothetical protein
MLVMQETITRSISIYLLEEKCCRNMFEQVMASIDDNTNPADSACLNRVLC